MTTTTHRAYGHAAEARSEPAGTPTKSGASPRSASTPDNPLKSSNPRQRDELSQRRTRRTNDQLQQRGSDHRRQPEDQHSHGKFWIDIDLDTREVAVSIPDRSGVSGEVYTFAPEDWDVIVTVINEAELHRGKVVSTSWSGQ